MRIASRFFGIIVAIVALTAFAAGCGSDSKVKKADVEKEAATKLAAQNNLPLPVVTCPGDLDGKVGATLECYLVAQGDTEHIPVKVVVDSVKDSTVNFSISVGTPPGGESPTSTSTP